MSQIETQLLLVFRHYGEHDKLFGTIPDGTQATTLNVQTVVTHKFSWIDDSEAKLDVLDILQPVQSAVFTVTKDQPLPMKLKTKDPTGESNDFV